LHGNSLEGDAELGVGEELHGEAQNEMSSVTFTLKVEILLLQAGVQLEESFQEVHEINTVGRSESRHIISNNRVSDTDRVINIQKMVIIVPGDFVKNRAKVHIVEDDSERTSFIITVTTRDSGATSQGKDQGSSVVDSGSSLVSSSSVELVKDFGARGLVDSDVASVKFTRIREIDGFLIDFVDFDVGEVFVNRIGFSSFRHSREGERVAAAEKEG